MPSTASIGAVTGRQRATESVLIRLVVVSKQAYREALLDALYVYRRAAR